MTSINCNPNIPKIDIYGWAESETNGSFSKYVKDSKAVTTNYTQNASPGITGNFTLSYTDMKGAEKELKGQLRKKLTTDMKGMDKELKG